MISKSASRMRARKIVKKIYPDLPRYKIVHHLDGNPFNNSIENLMILPNGFHVSHHLKGKKHEKIFSIKDLKVLELLIHTFNERQWI